jgi:hypothetical protein
MAEIVGQTVAQAAKNEDRIVVEREKSLVTTEEL